MLKSLGAVRSPRVTTLVVGALVAVSLVGCVGGASTVTGSPASTAEIAASLEGLRAATLAPAAIAVVVDGDARTAAASGTRSLRGAAVTPADSFRIGSITKPIVAALALVSVDRGEIGLDDVVSDLVPDVLRPAPPVTVRQLLSHTSGVFDEGNEGDIRADIARLSDPPMRAEGEGLLAKYAQGERPVAPDRLLVALAETHDRYFAPGEGYHYSNINYQLLGLILERVTGRSLGDLLRTRIVEPLGLHDTWLAPADRTSPDIRGYDSTMTGSMSDITDDLAMYGNGGNGGVVSTADELLVILRAVLTAKLFRADLVTEMEQPVRGSYGLGLGKDSLSCGTFYGHGGSVSGTQSIAMVSADGRRGVVVAMNVVSGSDPHLPAVAEAAVCGPGRGTSR